jgi:high-affinity nickel permease
MRTTHTSVLVCTGQKGLLKDRMRLVRELWDGGVAVCTRRWGMYFGFLFGLGF